MFKIHLARKSEGADSSGGYARVHLIIYPSASVWVVFPLSAAYALRPSGLMSKATAADEIALCFPV